MRQEFNDFLSHVSKVELDQIEKTLKSNPDFMLTPGNIPVLDGRDSQRTYQNIFIFQFAIWKQEHNLVELIKRCIPEGKNKRYFEELRKQYNDVMKNGVTIDGQKHTMLSTRHQMTSLIATLQEYADKYDHLNDDQRKQQWDSIDNLLQSVEPSILESNFGEPTPNFGGRTFPNISGFQFANTGGLPLGQAMMNAVDDEDPDLGFTKS